MNSEIVSQLYYLLFSGIASVLVWALHYRGRSYPASFKYATFAPRFWSGFVDSCVLWPIGFISAVILAFDIPRYLAALIVIFQSITWFVYTAQMHAVHGQTVGKMITKVRVVNHRTENKISLWQAWLRESIPLVFCIGLLGYQVTTIMTTDIEPHAIVAGKTLDTSNTYLMLITFLPCFWFLAEVLTMMTNKKRRALHDFIAGTVVIRTNANQGTSDNTM